MNITQLLYYVLYYPPGLYDEMRHWSVSPVLGMGPGQVNWAWRETDDEWPLRWVGNIWNNKKHREKNQLTGCLSTDLLVQWVSTSSSSNYLPRTSSSHRGNKASQPAIVLRHNHFDRSLAVSAFQERITVDSRKTDFLPTGLLCSLFPSSSCWDQDIVRCLTFPVKCLTVRVVHWVW